MKQVFQPHRRRMGCFPGLRPLIIVGIGIQQLKIHKRISIEIDLFKSAGLQQPEHSFPVKKARMIRIIQPIFFLQLSACQKHLLQMGIIVCHLDHQNGLNRHQLFCRGQTFFRIQHHIEHPIHVDHIICLSPLRHLRKQGFHIALFKIGEHLRMERLHRIGTAVNSLYPNAFLVKILEQKPFSAADIQQRIGTGIHRTHSLSRS